MSTGTDMPGTLTWPCRGCSGSGYVDDWGSVSSSDPEARPCLMCGARGCFPASARCSGCRGSGDNPDLDALTSDPDDCPGCGVPLPPSDDGPANCETCPDRCPDCEGTGLTGPWRVHIHDPA